MVCPSNTLATVSAISKPWFSNPFELIKTRMQAFASNPSIAVGHQHQYKGFFHASVDIIRTEGILSLYRGSSMNVIRSLFGSSTNLAVRLIN